MKAFKVYPFNFAANGAQIVLAEGSYFRVKTTTGDVAVQFDDNAPLGPINAGQGFKVPAGYKRLTVVDMSGAPNAGTVIVADGDFVDQQLSGVVQIVDGEKARTLAGGMFAAAASQAAVAAQFGRVQLWNPAASGKNLIVSQADAGSGTPVFYFKNAQLGNAYALPPGNKKAGAAAGVALLRVESAVANDAYGAVLRNAAGLWPIKGAIVVPPSFGLTLEQTVANTTAAAGFEWFEENQ